MILIGFPYFYVDFNLAYGYGHVIENKAKFNKNLPFVTALFSFNI